jgi:hypothetical protein
MVSIKVFFRSVVKQLRDPGGSPDVDSSSFVNLVVISQPAA